MRAARRALAWRQGLAHRLTAIADALEARQVSTVSRGDRIIASAHALWTQHIVEPPAGDPALIDDIIRNKLSLGWASANRTKGSRRRFYLHDGDFEWCGAFAARCYGEHGLRASIRRRDFASCYRLQRWARERPARRVALTDLQPGDILVVGDGKIARGKHITLVERVDGDTVYTYEGNAHGMLPDGTTGEGVIRRTRAIGKRPRGAECVVSGLPMDARALHGYRPIVADFNRDR